MNIQIYYINNESIQFDFLFVSMLNSTFTVKIKNIIDS